MVEIPADNLAKGGKLLKGGSFSAYIIVNMNAKATRETKSAIVKEITEAVARQFGTSPESQDIIVEIVKTEECNISHGGKLTYDSKPPDAKPPDK
jgi:phenylpyruvate tautomerase PptA (4-oxalocrotonate tautomerase family)